MTESEAIRELKDENEQCYEQCEGCCSEVKENLCTCRDATILSVLEQYRAIGTVEECMEARERQKPKKYRKTHPCKSVTYYQCPCCNGVLHINENFCGECGQAILWETEE